MLPALSGRRMGKSVSGVANALRDQRRNTAKVAGDGFDFDALLSLRQYTRADHDVADLGVGDQGTLYEKYVGFIPHGENELSLRVASPELIAGNFEDLHRYYEDLVVSCGAQNGGNADSLVGDERLSNVEHQKNQACNAILPEFGQDEALKLFNAVRYNAQEPFPYTHARSPYSIDADSKHDGLDNECLSDLGEELESILAAERTELDELVSAELIQRAKSEQFGRVVFGEKSGQNQILIGAADIVSSIDGSDQREYLTQQEGRIQLQPESKGSGPARESFEESAGEEYFRNSEDHYLHEEENEAAVDADTSLFRDEPSEEINSEPAGDRDDGSNSMGERSGDNSPEQDLLDEDDFHSEGGYTDGGSLDGFVDGEGLGPHQPSKHQIPDELQAFQAEEAALFGTFQSHRYVSPHSMPPIPPFHSAVKSRGSVEDPIAIVDSPVTYRGATSTASFDPPQPLMQPTARRLDINQNVQNFLLKSQANHEVPKQQPWRSNESGAYKQGTDELLKATLFNSTFLADYLRIYYPTEQLTKPWGYSQRSTRYKQFSHVEKDHFHAYVKRIVEVELLVDRLEEAQNQGEAMIPLASGGSMSGSSKLMPGSGTTVGVNAGGATWAQPVSHLKQQPEPNGTFDVCEDKISTNAQMFHQYHSSLDLDVAGFGPSNAQPSANNRSKFQSHENHQYENRGTKTAYGVSSPILANYGVDNMSVRHPHHTPSFFQGVEYRNRMSSMRSYENDGFESAYESGSDGLQQYGRYASNPGHPQTKSVSQGCKRKDFDTSIGAYEGSGDSVRNTKRSRRA